MIVDMLLNGKTDLCWWRSPESRRDSGKQNVGSVGGDKRTVEHSTEFRASRRQYLHLSLSAMDYGKLRHISVHLSRSEKRPR